MVDEDEAGRVHRREVTRDRAECGGCKVSSTLYEEGHYPRRQYQLDTVARVAGAMAIGGQTAPRAAATVTASPTSARRWTRWVALLTDPGELRAVTRKIDPDTPAGAGASVAALATRAAQVLVALEELGAAVLRRGMALVSRTGLGRVLEWQYRWHRVLVTLVGEAVHLSPAMALGVMERGS